MGSEIEGIVGPGAGRETSAPLIKGLELRSKIRRLPIASQLLLEPSAGYGTVDTAGFTANFQTLVEYQLEAHAASPSYPLDNFGVTQRFPNDLHTSEAPWICAQIEQEP